MAPITRSKERRTTVRQTTSHQTKSHQTTTHQTTTHQTTAHQTTVRQTTVRQTTARQTTLRQTTTRPPVSNYVLMELTVDHNKSCMLCHRKEISEKLYGKLYQLSNVIVHYFCILLSSGAAQNGLDHQGIWGFLLQDIISELQRGAKEICCYCKKNGATISCRGSKCHKVFHLPCGLRNGSLQQYFESFKSFCRQHRPKQIVDFSELHNTSIIQCAICKDDVIPAPLLSTLWAPCCKNNAWFHRSCVQELALNAGYFFKCPLCNDVEIFKPRMLLQGIYIPSRDASWETVPDAFAELLERHSTCNASICLCPHQDKRNYSTESGSWEIILCHTCGSNGTHKICNSNVCDEEWCCPGCQAIADTANKPKLRRLELPNRRDSSGSSTIVEGRSLPQRKENAERLMHNTSGNDNSGAQSNNETILISDDDSSDDSIQFINYTHPPKTTSLPVPRIPYLRLPLITNYRSSPRNRVTQRLPLSANNRKNIVPTSIVLTSDEEDDY